MTMHSRSLKIAAMIFVFAVGGAHAEEGQLNEADIQKVMPVLRAEAAALAAGQVTIERAEMARSSFSGDPLEFFRSRAKFDIPEGATYQAECSCKASAGGPVAIFTFGRTIDCYERTLRDFWRTVKRTPEEMLPPEPPIPQNCYIEREQTSKFLDDVQDALEKREFLVFDEGETARMLGSADGKLLVILYPHNIYDRANRPDDHPLYLMIESEQAREAALAACTNIPSGPILVLRPGENFFAGDGSDSLHAALKSAGLSQKEYEALKEALFLARMDVEMGTLQVAEAAAGDDPAERRALAGRRANANLYCKLAAQIRPLLDSLVPQP
jgi:hypothetical protein